MICKGECGLDKPLTVEFFHKHPQNKNGFRGACRECINKQRNARRKKYPYFYELEHNGEYKEGKIKAKDKDKALMILKMRFPKSIVKKCCTFKYKHKAVVRKKKGNFKNK